jgi:hypothetical protein
MTEVPWNRRVKGINLVPAEEEEFSVEVEWRIDLGGSQSSDTELGATLDLEINGVPTSTTDAEECLIWDLDAGGAFACEDLPDGASCGTGFLNTVPITLTCDAETVTCGVDFTTLFPSTDPIGNNTLVTVSLAPTAIAEPETVADDDSIEIVVGIELPSMGLPGMTALGLALLSSGSLVVRRLSAAFGRVGKRRSVGIRVERLTSTAT